MNHGTTLSKPTDRLEHPLAYLLTLFILISLYAAALGVLRLAIALGWYVSSTTS